MQNVSLIASAIRTPLYQMFLDSLEGSNINIDVVFAGPNPPSGRVFNLPRNVTFRYIATGNIKPAQCYEVARRNAIGELICWVADDCEFINGVLDKAYAFWKSLQDEKVVLSIQTREHYPTQGNRSRDDFCDMNNHSFFGGHPETPRMAPLGMMSRAYLERLGGIDRRYVCGQQENDIVMRVFADGGRVVSFGDTSTYIDINHFGKESIMLGRQAEIKDFQNRSFASGYLHDRKILEGSWSEDPKAFKMSAHRRDKFEPFSEEDLLIVSQGPKGIWQ